MKRTYKTTPEGLEKKRLSALRMNAKMDAKALKDRAKKGAETWRIRNEKALQDMRTVIEA